MPIKRLAFIVSHPIQYVTPLYQRLAQRDDLTIKVFFTWHAGQEPVDDRGFGSAIKWDIPLTRGYEFELIENVSSDPGTHRFLGLSNPDLVARVLAWQPDAIHITGWAWLSHLQALRAFRRMNVPTLFRGDSHLLDHPTGLRWFIKRVVLKEVYSWPSIFLTVGSANRAYYEAFGVQSARLCMCPHTIDVGRFAEPAQSLEREASSWRSQIGIADDRRVLLFAGKLEPKKKPLDLMRAVQAQRDRSIMLVLVGSGELEKDVKSFAAANPDRFRVLPFQNQSRMPIVYRLGDLFVLPSAYGETWGLAVNEALACGRPVLVSDRVGCAMDLIGPSCGRVFSWSESDGLERAIDEMRQLDLAAMGAEASKRAWNFDIKVAEAALVQCLLQVRDR